MPTPPIPPRVFVVNRPLGPSKGATTRAHHHASCDLVITSGSGRPKTSWSSATRTRSSPSTRLAERPYERKVIRAHFESLAARRDRRLHREAQLAIARTSAHLPVLQGPEVERRPLSFYEGLA